MSKHTNRNLSQQRWRRQERIFVSALQKCHTSTESMFKEERRTSLFIFHPVYAHALCRLCDAVLMTFLHTGKHIQLSLTMDTKMFRASTKKTTFISSFDAHSSSRNFVLLGRSCKPNPPWFDLVIYLRPFKFQILHQDISGPSTKYWKGFHLREEKNPVFVVLAPTL